MPLAIDLTLHGKSHAPGRAFHDANRMVLIASIEVHEFLFSDFAHLRGADLESFVLPGLLGLFLGGEHFAALLLFYGDTGGLLQKNGGRRALDLKRKRTVIKYRDDYRDCHTS